MPSMPDEVDLSFRFEFLNIYNSSLEQDSVVNRYKPDSEQLPKYIWSVVESLLDSTYSALKLPPLPPDRYLVVPNEDLSERDIGRASFLCPSRESLLEAQVCNAELLSLSDSAKPVWHFEVQLESSIRYSPGDAFGIFVENDIQLVSTLLNRLKVKDTLFVEDTKSVPPVRLEVSSALQKQFDLFSPPKKSFLRLLGEFCVDERERRVLLLLSSDIGRDIYRTLFIKGRVSFLDILQTFPSCEPPLQRVLDCLPCLMPRYYSASSCYEIKEKTISFVFSLVHTTILTEKEWTRRGHATGMFDNICSRLSKLSPDKTRLTIFHRPSIHFRPPENLKVPYMMICAGTGLAPFRGFVQQRRRSYEKWLASIETDNANQEAAVEKSSIGPIYLFFGCRKVGEFQCYLDEIEKDMSILPDSKLFICYSRGSGKEKYVQDLLKKHAEQVSSMITSHSSSCIYVCGDGARMAKGVEESLIDIVNEQIYSNKDDAKNFIKKLADEKRYVRDIWFWG